MYMYYTGIDPYSKLEVYVARNLHIRNLQRALLRFFNRRTGLPCERHSSRPAGRT